MAFSCIGKTAGLECNGSGGSRATLLLRLPSCLPPTDLRVADVRSEHFSQVGKRCPSGVTDPLKDPPRSLRGSATHLPTEYDVSGGMAVHAAVDYSAQIPRKRLGLGGLGLDEELSGDLCDLWRSRDTGTPRRPVLNSA